MTFPAYSPLTASELRARLLARIGLPVALIAATAACGGKVVFVDDGEGSGAGGDGTGASGAGGPGGSTSDGGAGGDTLEPLFPCEPPLEFDQSLVYECIFKDNGVCPSADSPEARSQLADILSWKSCDELCCDVQSVDDVACGPDPDAPNECCYLTVVGFSSRCMGRPFTVGGQARTAGPAPDRRGWGGLDGLPLDGLPRDVHLEIAAVPSSDRLHLAAAFAKSALMEHASVASFARFTLDLLSLGAPSDLVRDAQEAMGDEIRHAEICFGLAARYGGAAVGPGPLDIEGSAGPRSPERVLTDTVREGCVSETIAALLASRAAVEAQDPLVARALAAIAEDEARHAELAFRTVAWALGQGHPSWRAAIESAFAEPIGALDAEVPAGVDPGVWGAHGQLDQAATDATVVQARDQVIQACAAALLAPTAPPRVVAGLSAGSAG